MWMLKASSISGCIPYVGVARKLALMDPGNVASGNSPGDQEGHQASVGINNEDTSMPQSRNGSNTLQNQDDTKSNSSGLLSLGSSITVLEAQHTTSMQSMQSRGSADTDCGQFRRMCTANSVEGRTRARLSLSLYDDGVSQTRLSGGRILYSKHIEIFIGVVTTVNFLLILIDADINARGDSTPLWLVILGFLCLLIFTGELCLRIYVQACS